MFGWCADGHHATHAEFPCPGEVKKVQWEKQGKGRKAKDVLVETDEVRRCDCHCHPFNKSTNTKVVKMKKPRRKK